MTCAGWAAGLTIAGWAAGLTITGGAGGNIITFAGPGRGFGGGGGFAPLEKNGDEIAKNGCIRTDMWTEDVPVFHYDMWTEDVFYV